jgi:hypothetical protein
MVRDVEFRLGDILTYVVRLITEVGGIAVERMLLIHRGLPLVCPNKFEISRGGFETKAKTANPCK